MKNIFILSFLIFASSVFSQELETLIYIDNSTSINRATTLSMEVSSVVEASNEVGVLMLGDSYKDGKPNPELYDLNDENLLNNISNICWKRKKIQTPNEIYSTIADVIDKRKLVVYNNSDKNRKQMVPIDLHLFLNVSTFVLKDIYKNVVKQLIVDYKLTESQFNCIIHLDYTKKNEQYNDYIEHFKNKSNNIKIKEY